MHIAVVTLFPEMIAGFISHGVLSRAIAEGLLEVSLHNPRDRATDRHRTVDDRPYGGGPGMVMRPEPLVAAIRAARSAAERAVTAVADKSAVAPQRTTTTALTVFLTPQGQPFCQQHAAGWASVSRPLVLVAGRYEGIDQRVIDSEIDVELSLGDFVISGGEVCAMAVVDAVARLLPGTLGNDESAKTDSFGTDGLLEHPQYTRPEVFDGRPVPPVLMQGDHKEIAAWRRTQSLIATARKRPDLLQRAEERGEISESEVEQLQIHTGKN